MLKNFWMFFLSLLNPLMNESGGLGEGEGKGGEGEGEGKGQELQNYLGSWKTKEEAEKGHGELKKAFDTQGNEVGSLRKQVAELTSTLTQLMNNPPGQKPKEGEGGNVNPAETELGKIIEDIGTLDLVEDGANKKVAGMLLKAIKLTQQITKDETLKLAGDHFKSTLNKRDEEALRQSWLEKNPQFIELQKSGAFQALKSANPLHDDFSAYYDAQVQSLNQKISELTAELNKAKEVANLAGGDNQTGKIVTKPGAKAPITKPKTLQERHASAAQAVLNADAKGGQ